MNMIKNATMSMLVVSCSGAVGCTRIPAETATSGATPRIRSITPETLTPCSPSVPPSDVAKYVRVTIPEAITLDPKDRDIETNDRPDVGASDWKPVISKHTPDNNIFHVDVKEIENLDTTRPWLKVFLVLQHGSRWSFLDFGGTSGHSFGVARSAGTPATQICTDGDGNGAAAGPVSFYARIPAKDSPLSYNIGLLPNVVGAETPIIIDPKILNKG